MPELNAEILQLGTLGIIFLFCAKEFFSYLKSRKETTEKKDERKDDEINQAILNQLQTQNENHLIHIGDSIERLNCSIRDGNEKIIALLSEIKGNLTANR